MAQSLRHFARISFMAKRDEWQSAM